MVDEKEQKGVQFADLPDETFDTPSETPPVVDVEPVAAAEPAPAATAPPEPTPAPAAEPGTAPAFDPAKYDLDPVVFKDCKSLDEALKLANQQYRNIRELDGRHAQELKEARNLKARLAVLEAERKAAPAATSQAVDPQKYPNFAKYQQYLAWKQTNLAEARVWYQAQCDEDPELMQEWVSRALLEQSNLAREQESRQGAPPLDFDLQLEAATFRRAHSDWQQKYPAMEDLATRELGFWPPYEDLYSLATMEATLRTTVLKLMKSESTIPISLADATELAKADPKVQNEVLAAMRTDGISAKTARELVDLRMKKQEWDGKAGERVGSLVDKAKSAPAAGARGAKGAGASSETKTFAEIPDEVFDRL